MSENLKYGLLLIVLVAFSIFEIAYVLLQLKAIWMQKCSPVKVFPKGAVKYTSIFSIIVGIVMIYTFIVSDSFLYNDSRSAPVEGMMLGYKAWHGVYTLGKVAGLLIIIGALLSIFTRFSINTNEIITGNGQIIPAAKCMFAVNENIVTVTYSAGGATLPVVLLKFRVDNKTGQEALAILDEHYRKL